jgi:uncharacterized lipoprotein YajG
MKTLLMIAAAALLAGCATYYRNLNASVNFASDSYQCQRENTSQVFLALNGAAATGSQTDWSMVDACLKARGWYEVSKP